MDISLEKLKKTMENNGRVLELYAAYLNNEPCLVESDTVKSICDDCHVSTEQAFAAILSAAFGLDGEENADDLVSVLDQTLQGGHGEGRRPHENDPHSSSNSSG